MLTSFIYKEEILRPISFSHYILAIPFISYKLLLESAVRSEILLEVFMRRIVTPVSFLA